MSNVAGKIKDFIYKKEYSDDKGRDYYFDNAKFMVIVLVVLAHFTSPLKTTVPAARAVWNVINAFHMPCLIIISGYFAKNYVTKDGVIKKQRLFTYFIYYIAAQLTLSLFEYYVLGTKKMAISAFAPRSSLWYLMCLICWYLILPMIHNVKPGIMLSVAVVCGLLVGYDTTMDMGIASLGRVVNHFPFFLVGYYFKKEWLYKIKNVWTALAGLLLFGITLIWTYYNPDKITPRIITSSNRYITSNLIYFKEHFMWMNRLLYYIAALILCGAFMLMVPRIKMFFTRFGARTLQVYIIHRFLYLAELQYRWYEPYQSMEGYIKVAILSVVLTFVMSLKIFEYPFRWLGSIKLSWFERKTEKTIGK